MKRYLVCGLFLFAGCATDSVTSPAGSPSLKVQSEALPGPVVEDYDFSCDGRDKEVAQRVALSGNPHPNGFMILSNNKKVFLQDTYDGYDVYDVPEAWCTGRDTVRLGEKPNLSHLVSCGGAPITPDTFATSPHPDPGSSCWSLDGVTKRRF